MAGKSPKKKYGEFRIFAQYMGKGKFRINPAFVPSLAAFLLMHGKVYQRAIDAMNNRIATDTVPGLKESVEGLEKCQAHLQRLMDSLTTNFARDDWFDAVHVVSELMGIKPDSTPLDWVPVNQFQHVITERDTDGINTRGE